MRLLVHLLELDLPLFGHGYEFGDGFRGESDADEREGGIPTLWIVAALGVAAAAIGVLVSLDPSGAIAKLRAHAAKAVILVIIAAPLIAWTYSSRGDADLDDIFVERLAAGLDGAPELVVSLGNKAMNTLEFTDGKRVVRVECFDRDGELVLTGKQKWPFVFERGYEYAHAHQRASREQLEQVARCRLVGGSVDLEAGVKGALK